MLDLRVLFVEGPTYRELRFISDGLPWSPLSLSVRNAYITEMVRNSLSSIQGFKLVNP